MINCGESYSNQSTLDNYDGYHCIKCYRGVNSFLEHTIYCGNKIIVNKGNYTGNGKKFIKNKSNSIEETYCLEYDGEWKEGKFHGNGKSYLVFENRPLISSAI